MNKSHRPMNVVIDTDTYNEIDDQFALVYSLLSPEKLNVKGVYAAPFLNKNSLSPEDGMIRSYHEIIKIFNILEIQHSDIVYKGSTMFLENEAIFQQSDATKHLIKLVKESTEKVYVLALAALTNVASAILLCPEIVDKLHVVWLGGHDMHAYKKNEFNLRQDIAAARVVFDSGVELTQIPCIGVVSGLVVTIADMNHHFAEKTKIGSYLTDLMNHMATGNISYSRTIADLAPIAFMVNPEWVPTVEMKRPEIMYDLEYNFTNSVMKYNKAVSVNRDEIISDLIDKVNK